MIEDVRPRTPNGYPAKAVVERPLRVSAVAFRDGGYLDRLAEANDFVIVDTPAVRSAEIASTVGPASDGALFVVNPNGLVASDLRGAFAELRGTGVTLLGTIQNGVRVGRAAYLDDTPET